MHGTHTDADSRASERGDVRAVTATGPTVLLGVATEVCWHSSCKFLSNTTDCRLSGLVCTDAGITSGVIVSEYGYGNFGAQYGGERTSWDLSHVGLSINLATSLSSSDGQSVRCAANNCPDNQAYSYPTDYAADRNSALGQTYTHTFCA